MKYKRLTGYKFELAEDVEVTLRADFQECEANYFSIHNRALHIKAGYQWDGASGPTVDTDSTMTAALVHDVLYQCIRAELVPSESRADADMELYRLMRQRGVADASTGRWKSLRRLWAEIRACYFLIAVRLFGGASCRARAGKKEQQDIIYEV